MEVHVNIGDLIGLGIVACCSFAIGFGIVVFFGYVSDKWTDFKRRRQNRHDSGR